MGGSLSRRHRVALRVGGHLDVDDAYRQFVRVRYGFECVPDRGWANSAVIPKIIHQIFLGGAMPASLATLTSRMKSENPSYAYRLWTDGEPERYIFEHYGNEVLSAYERICPEYYAAKTDLFRYLLVYREGGVYLDCKSRFAGPIDEHLTLDEGYVLTRWREGAGKGAAFDHAALAHIPGGEFDNWHVIAEPQHPFLKAVIERVLANIRHFKPWHNVGRAGVLKLTGPIPYTLAIHPLLGSAKCALTTTDILGLTFSAPAYDVASLQRRHYSKLKSPILRMGAGGRALSRAAMGLRSLGGSRSG